MSRISVGFHLPSGLLASLLLLIAATFTGCVPDEDRSESDRADIADVLELSELYKEQVLTFELPRGNFDMCFSNPEEAKTKPELGYGLDLNTARWMAFFAGNTYAHHLRVAPLLEELGFGDVGEAEKWRIKGRKLILSEIDARNDILPIEEKAAQQKKVAKDVQNYVQEVVPGKKLQFFTAGEVNPETNEFEHSSTQFAWVEHRTEPVVIIAFRGTEASVSQDLLTDVNFFQYPIEGLGEIHAGFAEAYNSVIKILTAKLRAEEGRGLKIYITGHSLGGALAVLAAVSVMRVSEKAVLRDRYDPTKVNRLMGVYSFGKPRVGDNTFLLAFDKRVKEHEALFTSKEYKHEVAMMRFRNEDDRVTDHPWSKPFFGQTYTHTGSLMHLLQEKDSNGDKIFDMNPKVQDPTSFIPQVWNLSDHSIVNYYERIKKHAEDEQFANVTRRCAEDGKTRIE